NLSYPRACRVVHNNHDDDSCEISENPLLLPRHWLPPLNKRREVKKPFSPQKMFSYSAFVPGFISYDFSIISCLCPSSSSVFLSHTAPLLFFTSGTMASGMTFL